MKSLLAHLLLIALLVLAGAILWAAGGTERQLVAAERTLVTLRYEAAADEFEAASTPSPVRRLLGDVTGATATAAESERRARYWLGDYERFTGATDDVTLKMLAADAAYRTMRKQGGTWQSFVTKCDDVAKRYAEVLKDHPENEDAAYNYEFVLRLRNAVAAARQPVPAVDFNAIGLSVHGRAGGPPQGSDTKKFKMIVPMRPDERQEAEEAGRGGQKTRKG
jgi:hypothetical protein